MSSEAPMLSGKSSAQMVFHGTSRANFGSLLQGGMDQSHPLGEWFADVVSYCHYNKAPDIDQSYSFLVFLVVKVPSSVVITNGPMVVLSRPELQLPLCEATFTNKPIAR